MEETHSFSHSDDVHDDKKMKENQIQRIVIVCDLSFFTDLKCAELRKPIQFNSNFNSDSIGKNKQPNGGKASNINAGPK